MKDIFSGLVSGLLFGAGLALSGMTQPPKVQGFLDVFGNWDPSLAFVMFGAIAVHAIGYAYMRRQNRPFFSSQFQLPRVTSVDAPLIVGAVLFGIGWGMSGFCPGPAFASILSFHFGVFIFVGSMIAGMFIESLVGGKK